MCSKIFNVNGPISVSYHKSSIYKKEIYIFGENHGPIETDMCSSNNGVDVPYIYDIIFRCNGDKIIDFFVEDFRCKTKECLDINNIRHDETLKNINIVRKHFTNCVTNKKLCKIMWPNMRYHSVDRRFSNDSDTSVLELQYNFTRLFYTGDYSVSEIKNEIDKMFKIFNILHCYKIVKQIKNIKSLKIRKFILKWYNIKLKEIHERNEKIGTVDTKPNNVNIVQKLNEYYYIYIDFLCILMDVYTIARIFRSFYDHNSKYIIIHVGDFHAINYREILKELKFSEILCLADNYPKVKDFCVDVKSLNLPHFGNKYERSKKRVRL